MSYKYNLESCPKSSTWFSNGGRCGWAHECSDCSEDPDNKNKRKNIKGKKMEKIELLLIDPQRDFCDPTGSLYVGGADEDMKRVSQMIKRMGKGLSDIHTTLDQHHKMDVAHPLWWKNSEGKNPDPFTIITASDVEEGIWTPSVSALRPRMLEYTRELERKGRYPLCVWVEHCLIATYGATIMDSINESLSEWILATKNIVNFVAKGSNPFTEHYSGVQAEVVDPSDPTTQLNVKLIQALEEADLILLAGEALGHCLANTARDISDNFSSENYIKKMVLLTDGSSSVAGFENLGEDFIKELTAKGMQLAKTTDF
jgi:nicotinamidase/pyrazinamidase